MRAHEEYVEAGGGVRLYCRRMGDGAKTVVVVHGGPGFSMEYLADDLAPLARCHRVVFYDQRGSGRSSLVSDGASLDAQRFVDDLEALRLHLGLERLTLLGHSWGAGVVGLYALRHPQRIERMILVGPIPLRHSELQRTFQHVAAGRSESELAQLAAAGQAWRADPGNAIACRAFYRLWYLPFFSNPTALDRSQGDFCFGTPAALANKIAAVDRYTVASLGEYDWREPLRGVAAPTLVLHGSVDVISVDSAREWVAALADARLLLLQGVGHFPYLETPEAFFAAVDEFVSGAWPRDAQRASAP
jgi:proline iminopeptidase